MAMSEQAMAGMMRVQQMMEQRQGGGALNWVGPGASMSAGNSREGTFRKQSNNGTNQ